MEQQILSDLARQGPFAALFIWLLWWVLKTNDQREERMEKNHNEREDRLIEALDTLGQKYDGISKDVKEIKDKIYER